MCVTVDVVFVCSLFIVVVAAAFVRSLLVLSRLSFGDENQNLVQMTVRKNCCVARNRTVGRYGKTF